MKSARQFFLINLIIVSLVTGVVAVMWDGWWHLVLGRDSFLIPPHLLLYSAVTIALSATFYGLVKYKTYFWKKIFLSLIVLLLAAVLDVFWHNIFGIEDFSTPLAVWSPPHVLAMGAVILSLLLINQGVEREKILTSRFFSGLALAGVLSFVMTLLGPIYPLGPYKVLGFWGAGIVVCTTLLLLFYAHKKLPGIGGAIDVIVYSIVIMVSGPLFGGKVTREINVPLYPLVPNWILVFSFLVPAIIVDFPIKLSLSLKGLVAGFLWGVILYGFTSSFLGWPYHYNFSETMVAILASTIGGLAAGFLVSKLQPLQR